MTLCDAGGKSRRPKSEGRQRHKNAYWVTDGYLQEIHAAHRYDSDGAFPLNVPHLRLETGHLAAEVAAQRIVKHFGL